MTSGSASFLADSSTDANLFRQPYELPYAEGSCHSTPAYPPFLHSAMFAVAAAAAAGYPQQLAANPINTRPLNLTANPTNYQYPYTSFYPNDVRRMSAYYPHYQYCQQQQQHPNLIRMSESSEGRYHSVATASSTGTLTYPLTTNGGTTKNSSGAAPNISSTALPNNPAIMRTFTAGSQIPVSAVENGRHHQQQLDNSNLRSSIMVAATTNAAAKPPSGKSSRGRKTLTSDEAVARKRQEFDELVKARTDKLLSDGPIYTSTGEPLLSGSGSAGSGFGAVSSSSTSAAGTTDSENGTSPNYKKLIQAVLDAKKSALLRSPNVMAVLERQQLTLSAYKQKTELFSVNHAE